MGDEDNNRKERVVTYHVTKAPQSCGHRFQISTTNNRGIGKVVVEISFLDLPTNAERLAERAALAMLEGMAPVWTLTSDGPRRPDGGHFDPPETSRIGLPREAGFATVNEIRAQENLGRIGDA